MKMDSTALVRLQYQNVVLQFTMFYPCMQMLMNVRGMKTTVMRMHSALTQRGDIPALATLATLEMESTVQVSYMR